ncbi:MAG: hypothetical protein EX271_09050 [Acidimicrobiales bacterium]|nr:hypothetical protein [Hyphomonadaceae bacterium]RZV40951.1 MAG: hypothetical protein EX271_09050 [Acidimicrobiales bacterium]
MKSGRKKNLIAVISGIVAGVATVFVVESIGHMIYPPPADIDLSNKEDMKRLMSVMPLGAKVSVTLAWLAGSFVAAATTLKLSAGNKKASWIPVVFLLLAGIATMFSFPHPGWMIVAGITLPLIGGWLAQKLFA